MDKKFHLKIITPDRELYSGNVVSLNCETTDGKRGILPNHWPMLSVLIPTETTFQDIDGDKKHVFTSDGVIKVNRNQVTMLCNAAEWPNEIDKERAINAKYRAEQRLKEKSPDTDLKRAQYALYRAIGRLNIVDKI